MKTTRKVDQSIAGLLAHIAGNRDGLDAIEQPAGNASKPLEKPRTRRKAHADQAILQEKGANALPVSDYPLKEGPLAANSLDRRQQSLRKEAKGG